MSRGSPAKNGKGTGGGGLQTLGYAKAFHIQEKSKVGEAQSNHIKTLRRQNESDKTQLICLELDQKGHVNPSTARL